MLKDRNARWYLGAVPVNGSGTNALWLAAGVWGKELTGSDGLAALCLLAMWAPTAAGPLLGTLTDRMRRGPLLVGLNLAMAVLLPFLVVVDSAAQVWLVLAVLLAYGTTAVLSDAAEAALMPSVVPRELLGDFNGLRMTATEGVKPTAPLAGAGLYAAHGGASVAVLDVVTCVLSAALIAGVRVCERAPERPSARWWEQAEAGARQLWGHPALRPLVSAGGAAMLGAGLNRALVYAVVEGLGRSPAHAGVLAAVQGVGSVVVGVAAAGRAAVRGGGHRADRGGGDATGGAVRRGGAGIGPGDRGGAALCADRRADGRAARGAGRGAGPYGRRGEHRDVHAERDRSGRRGRARRLDAVRAAAAAHRSGPAADGGSAGAERFAYDRRIAVRRQPGVTEPQFRRVQRPRACGVCGEGAGATAHAVDNGEVGGGRLAPAPAPPGT